MRSLEECKNEVFNRSNARIKKRQKLRKQILVACVPLCLCIIVLSVAFWASIKSGSSDIISAEIQKLDSTEAGTVLTITDQKKVENLYSKIQKVCQENDDCPVDNGGIGGSPEIPDEELEIYHITFELEGRGRESYVLSKKLLRNEATGKRIALTERQFYEIRSMFQEFMD